MERPTIIQLKFEWINNKEVAIDNLLESLNKRRPNKQEYEMHLKNVLKASKKLRTIEKCIDLGDNLWQITLQKGNGESQKVCEGCEECMRNALGAIYSKQVERNNCKVTKEENMVQFPTKKTMYTYRLEMVTL